MAETMSSQVFNYISLENKDEIRLISIQPSADIAAPIECATFHARLSENPEYEALSYMWGSEEHAKSASIDSKEFHVRHNLFAALQQFRLKAEPRVMWIDAICINQNDISERNHQVRQMGAIYSQASQVVVWLGEETGDSGRAIAFLEKLGDGSIPGPQCDKLCFKQDWKALKRFCEADYWNRQWIIQEVLLSSRIFLQQGQHIMDWANFSKVLAILRERENFQTWQYQETKDLLISTPAVLAEYQVNSEIGDGFGIPLIALLVEFPRSLCSDIRDKLFGFHSLTMECCRAATPVDYSNPTALVFRGAMEHHFEHHFHYYFQHHFQLHDNDRNKFPEWDLEKTWPSMNNEHLATLSSTIVTIYLSEWLSKVVLDGDREWRSKWSDEQVFNEDREWVIKWLDEHLLDEDRKWVLKQLKYHGAEKFEEGI